MIRIISIPQLKDNFSYAILKNKKVIIIDPAESISVLKYIESESLTLKAILLTHHHTDHTAGVKDILNEIKVPVYSPNKEIECTTKIVEDKDILEINSIKIEVISTPGHTIDHVVFYIKQNNILFSGDTLFRLGCGRVFEGTKKQMFNSLQKIYALDNRTIVYCGHEYTNNNLNFLLKIFPENRDLFTEKKKIDLQLQETNCSVPFSLEKEKLLNPFLAPNSDYLDKFKESHNLTDFELFSHLRDLKNNF